MNRRDANKLLNKFKQKIIMNDETKDTLKVISDIHDQCVIDNPKSLVIEGPPGVGKTRLAKHFLSKNQARFVETDIGQQYIVKAFYIKVIAETSIKGFAEKICQELCITPNTRATTSQLTKQVINGLKNSQTEIVFIDEIHDLHYQNTGKKADELRSWLKGLLEEISIPVIFLGTPGSADLFKQNAELKRRVPQKHEMQAFEEPKDKSYEIVKTLNSLFVNLEEITGLVLDKKINRLDLARRIYFSTGGRIDGIKQLIEDLSIELLERDFKVLDMKGFEKIFSIKPPPESLVKKNINPFSEGYIA